MRHRFVAWGACVLTLVSGVVGSWACSGDDGATVGASDGGGAGDDGTTTTDDSGGGGGSEGGGGGRDAGGGGDANKGDGNPDNACGALAGLQCFDCCSQNHPGGFSALADAEVQCACQDNGHCLGGGKCGGSGGNKTPCLSQVGKLDASAQCTACFNEVLMADSGNSCVPTVAAQCGANAACAAMEICLSTQCSKK